MVFLHMINHNLSSDMIRKVKLLILLLILHSNQGVTQTREIGGTGDFVDGIAAIVNDGVVLRSEVEDQVTMLLRNFESCLLYTSPSPRDLSTSRMPSSA